MAKNLLVSPKLKLVYPHLNEPDTKYVAAPGEYHTKAVADPNNPEVVTFLALLDSAYDAAVAKAKKENPGKNIKLGPKPYTRLEDGLVQLKFKSKAGGTTRDGRPWKRDIQLFDAQLQRLDSEVKVGGGSIAKVSYEIFPWYTAALGAGITLRVEGAQVLELVSYGGPAGESMGFAAEDGFTGGTEATGQGEPAAPWDF